MSVYLQDDEISLHGDIIKGNVFVQLQILGSKLSLGLMMIKSPKCFLVFFHEAEIILKKITKDLLQNQLVI